MIKLLKDKYKSAYRVYEQNQFFFPLVAAVLLDEQDGVVYANHANSPSQIYVEHVFGFAQLFGDSDQDFEQTLEAYLLNRKTFDFGKIRLYCPSVPSFLLNPRTEAELSERQRFHLDRNVFEARKMLLSEDKSDDVHIRDLMPGDVAAVESSFKLVTRFWRTPEDYVEKANACLVFKKDHLASICYSAATASGRAEIDVLTLSEYRGLGLALRAVAGFLDKCLNSGISPLWDCYTNNDASIALAHAVGFARHGEAYPFYTIKR